MLCNDILLTCGLFLGVD